MIPLTGSGKVSNDKLNVMRTTLVRYVKYNAWANQRLLDLISEQCSDVQLNRELISSFPTIRKTLLHIWGAESVWLLRLQGTSPSTWSWMDFTGTQEELKKVMLENDRNWLDFIESKDENYLYATFDYKAIDGTAYASSRVEAIHHCMNHSTFHRGQLVTLLRQVGITKLPSTDYITFSRL